MEPQQQCGEILGNGYAACALAPNHEGDHKSALDTFDTWCPAFFNPPSFFASGPRCYFETDSRGVRVRRWYRRQMMMQRQSDGSLHVAELDDNWFVVKTIVLPPEAAQGHE